MSVIETPPHAAMQTVGEVDVNYRWVTDGELVIWVKECDDLSFEDALRVIRCALDYWIDGEIAQQRLSDGPSKEE